MVGISMFNYLLLVMLSSLTFMGYAKSAKDHQFHHPQAFIKEVSGKNNAGEKIYKQFCAVCHAKKPSIVLGAPRIGVENEWKHRTKQGVDVMLAKIDAGLNAMPPRGGCFECSDADLKAAIAYMLPKK